MPPSSFSAASRSQDGSLLVWVRSTRRVGPVWLPVTVKMARLLIVGVGLMGRPYVTAAIRLGHHVDILEAPGWIAPPELSDARVHLASELVGSQAQLDGTWVGAALDVAMRIRPTAVLAFAERHVLAAAWVAERLGLPGPSLGAAVISRNKALQRSVLKASGAVAQPEHLLTQDRDIALEWAEQRYPVVGKIADSSGSEGVELLTSRTELLAKFDRDSYFLIEEFVCGSEYSWEGFFREGAAIFGSVTEKRTTGAPEFVELGHMVPAGLPADTTAAIGRFAAEVARGAGIRTSLVHIEFRMRDGVPVLMEFAVRTPGDFLLDLMADAYAIDPYEQVVRLLTGDDAIPAPSAPVLHAAIGFFCPAPGIVTSIEGLDGVARIPFITAVKVNVEAGGTVHPLVSSKQRIGYVRVAAPTDAQARAALGRALAELVILTRADNRP